MPTLTSTDDYAAEIDRIATDATASPEARKAGLLLLARDLERAAWRGSAAEEACSLATRAREAAETQPTDADDLACLTAAAHEGHISPRSA